MAAVKAPKPRSDADQATFDFEPGEGFDLPSLGILTKPAQRGEINLPRIGHCTIRAPQPPERTATEDSEHAEDHGTESALRGLRPDRGEQQAGE